MPKDQAAPYSLEEFEPGRPPGGCPDQQAHRFGDIREAIFYQLLPSMLEAAVERFRAGAGRGNSPVVPGPIGPLCSRAAVGHCASHPQKKSWVSSDSGSFPSA